MGTSLKEYMEMEDWDFTLPWETYIPSASDSPKERAAHAAVRRREYADPDDQEEDQ